MADLGLYAYFLGDMRITESLLIKSPTKCISSKSGSCLKFMKCRTPSLSGYTDLKKSMTVYNY